VVFKRRRKRSYSQIVAEGIYPRGGWKRAAYYVLYRLRRLPDPPHKIARGVAAGVFVCFTPLFGLHFLLAALLTRLMRGNILASILATFFGNPLTFPFIAAISVDLGSWILGQEQAFHLSSLAAAFTDAFRELWFNLAALFSEDAARWGNLRHFFHRVFLPYLIGGIGPGLLTAALAYMITRPVIAAYQRNRIRRLKNRYEKRRREATIRSGARAKRAYSASVPESSTEPTEASPCRQTAPRASSGSG